MRRLPIYLLYLATALRAAYQVAERRDPTLTILLLLVYGALLFSEHSISRRLFAAGKGPAPARLAGEVVHTLPRPKLLFRALHPAAAVLRYRLFYMLTQCALVLAMLLPPRTPDTFLIFFFPLAFQAVDLFGWRAGRWWIAAFLAPMLVYVALHPEINNLVMALVIEACSFLLGGLAGMMQKAEAARLENLRLADELQRARAELEQYASQVEELAAERARTALARELHDSVTQTAFSMNLAVEAARLMLPRQPRAAAAQLERVEALAQNAMGEIGRLVSQLRPAAQPDDLLAGLRRLVESCRLTGELQVELQAELPAPGEGRPLAAQVSTALCCIAQEALANVRKHAGTSRACIRLDLSSRPGWLEVEDGGGGFDPQAALERPGHLGLREMSERALEIGWELSIDSAAGRGTRLRVQERL